VGFKLRSESVTWRSERIAEEAIKFNRTSLAHIAIRVSAQIPHKLIQTDVIKFVRAEAGIKKRVGQSACGDDCHSIAGGAIRNKRPTVGFLYTYTLREKQRQYSTEPPHDCFFGTMAFSPTSSIFKPIPQ